MRTVAVVPAYRNEDTISSTVRALLADPRILEVVVVDDGSGDLTPERASGAGARVIRLDENRGKGEALERAIDGVPPADAVLMVDGDTGSSAAAAVVLLEPLVGGEADMAVAVLPPAGRKGGFGLVKRLARGMIRRASGFESRAPLSGQRAVRMEVLVACRPLAHGFGVDAALTTDAVLKGFRVVELPVPMSHRDRGRSPAGFIHRGRQGWDLWRAMRPRVRRGRRFARRP